jgi:hypothetical protein
VSFSPCLKTEDDFRWSSGIRTKHVSYAAIFPKRGPLRRIHAIDRESLKKTGINEYRLIRVYGTKTHTHFVRSVPARNCGHPYLSTRGFDDLHRKHSAAAEQT